MPGEREVSGQCLCGGVRFRAVADAPSASVCHCKMCQRWAAGPLVAVHAVSGTLTLEGEEHLGVYPSSDWGERCFCMTCGSPLIWRSRDGSIVGISAGALNDTDGFVLSEQIFIEEKPPYYEFANETENLTGPELIAKMTGGEASKE